MTNARFCIIPARALGDKRLNRTDIMTLNALGLFGNRAGWCYPSLKKIAQMIDAHRVSVSNAVTKLTECGYLQTRARHREDGSQTSNEYRILYDVPDEQIDMDFAMDAGDPVSESATPPVAAPLPPCSESTTPPIASEAMGGLAEPLPHINVPLNDLSERSPAKKNYPNDFEDFFKLWPKERRCEKLHAYCEWKKACREVPPDQIHAAASAYMQGKEAVDGFAPYPAKWLARGRWQEYQPEAEEEAGADVVDDPFLTGLHAELLDRLGAATYRSWFKGKLKKLKNPAGGTIILIVPSRFIAEWLTQHYLTDVFAAARAIDPVIQGVSFTVWGDP